MIGIYRIRNLANGHCYIGSSIRMASRLAQHHCDLIRNDHRNQHLQRAWNKYGSNNFAFEKLFECAEWQLSIREQRFIDAYKDHGIEIYNARPSAESRIGFRFKHSDETKLKIGEAFRGKPGQKHSAETRAKISAVQIGRKASAETRAKMSVSQKARPPRPPISKDTRDKMRFAAILRSRIPLSEETLRRRSDGIKKSWVRRKGCTR